MQNCTDNHISPLKKYAFLGGANSLFGKMEYLASIAEKEDWRYDSPNASTQAAKKYAVLFQYLHHTFARAQDENKIVETATHSIMNTGLFTPNGEEIFLLFTLNTHLESNPMVEKWYMAGFYKESSHDIPIDLRSQLPAYVDYFKDCPEDLYFNPTYRIFTNFDHIIDENFARLPETIQAFGKDIVKTIFEGAIATLQKKIVRNNRLAVPQYYHKKIMYLLPLQVGGFIVPLAVEKHENTYRANTIFTPGMAYCNARLVMRPESNWMTSEYARKSW